MPAIPAPFTAGDQFFLPEFPYLLPAYTHPASQRIARDCESWIRTKMRFALPDDGEIERLIEERASLWTCYVLPTAMEERLSTLCKYTEYLSVFDNAMVDREKIGKDVEAAKELFHRVVNILGNNAAGADFEWGRTLHELWTAMRPDFPDRQWDRFMAEVQRFLAGCIHEITSRSEEKVFDYDTYLQVRRDSVGMGMYFVLGEYGLGIDLTDHLKNHAALRDIIDIALEHIMLTNDLFSFRAECVMDDYVNALSVLRVNNGLSLQDGVDELFSVIEERRVAFMRARRAIEKSSLGEDPDVLSYLDALWHMMAGNLQWSYETARYNGVGHRWNGHRRGVVTLHADRTEFGDRPYWSLAR
ncbi:terpene synthase family protein [Amycolatopsis taiwanensis]|uniref:Terpene synthase n=1 Tax=Amycolatopsis taiwanensis TaxID=342230 RepID=A0A9W6R3S1_9PSEU|nr:terpene synthase family protein [Amycolatopsis taiwanensis]GLY68966.1 hypothetical protein Atai01_55850 [Amycolatopsis taiwanensis]